MSGERILVVEDSLTISALIQKTLVEQGYEVVAAVDNGPDAIVSARDLKPDVVLMDIVLKGTMTGIDAAEAIRESQKIPVIYLTTQTDEPTVSRAIRTDPFGYLVKPLDEKVLKTTIQVALYKNGIETELRERERTITVLLNAIPDALALLDRQFEIVAVNDAMAEKLGVSQESVVGKTLEELAAAGIRLITQERINTVYATENPVMFEEKCGDRWYETMMYPVTDATGTIVRIAIQSHDITDWKHLAAELKMEGLSQIEQNMEQFQVLNDKIRNPLQAIRGLAALTESRYSSQIDEQVEIIDDLVTRLDRGWVESDKVRSFLMRHYRHGNFITPHRQHTHIQ